MSNLLKRDNLFLLVTNPSCRAFDSGLNPSTEDVDTFNTEGNYCSATLYGLRSGNGVAWKSQ